MKQERKRLFMGRKTSARNKAETIKWAASNGYDTVVFSLGERPGANGKYIKLAKRYGLAVEAGGHDLSLLLPRRLFLFHRDLFRMEEGRRKADHHFCPTNPKTTALIAEHARALFARAMREMTFPRVFHLLPDEGCENVWCACPACRAFNPSEQNIIAVNTAADALAKLDTDSLLAYQELGTEGETEGITPRKNTFQSKT